VNGPSPTQAALDFLHQMQAGKVNRDNLGEEFGLFLTSERLQAAAPRLKALGDPDKVEVNALHERGGMEVASIHFKFKSTGLGGLLYRTPDGKIQQFLIRKQ
jgi:D-alanyl-D-alanine carboxypeptidase